MDLKIYANELGGNALNQIYTLAREAAFENSKIRIMPDAHAGIGAVVGFTATLTDKIIPNVIGVDIGCGMRIYDLGYIDIDFEKLDDFIKRNIPSGTSIRKEHSGEELIHSLICFPYLKEHDRLYGSMGTLGGGNHFIEIDVSEDGKKHLVIHTGSRNLGTQVANIYQKLAIKNCKEAPEEEREALIAKLKAESRQAEIPDELERLSASYAHKTKIPNQLCYLEGINAEKYLHDMRICQEFARMNREKIGNDIIRHLGLPRASFYESVHNFIGDDNIIRKGSIPAYKGQKLLIPINMRDGCIVGEGLGNPDWNYSAPHGAGRLMSRSDAKAHLTLEEYEAAMEGIYTTTATKATLDEAPMAYKPIEEILSLVIDSIKIVEIIKPVYNFKAPD